MKSLGVKRSKGRIFILFNNADGLCDSRSRFSAICFM